jgi:hypothetical protein
VILVAVSGPYPLAGEIETTSGAVAPVATTLTLPICETAAVIKLMFVPTMLAGLSVVAEAAPVAAVIREGWPANPAGAQLPCGLSPSCRALPFTKT